MSFQIMHRQKAFNPFALVGFITEDMEQYYRQRLLKFALARDVKQLRLCNRLNSKAEYLAKHNFALSSDMTVQVCNSNE